MAKFVYKMQSILDIKLRLETQAKTEYGNAMSAYSDEQEKMRALINSKKKIMNSMCTNPGEKIDFNKIKIANESVRAVDELMKQQALALRVAEKKLEVSQQNLSNAVQERKVYEKLKEKSFEEFKEQMNADEMKEVDQLISFTYGTTN